MLARLVRALPLALLSVASACKRSEPATVGVPELVESAAPAAADAASANGVDAKTVSLIPAGFPRDVPIPAGLVATSVQSENAGSYVALFTGELEPEGVHERFARLLTEEGWTIDRARSLGPEFGLFASKGERIATVIATRLDGKLHVELGIYGGD